MASPKKFGPKVALLGSGMIGHSAALILGLQELTNNIVLLDVVEDMPTGKALDLGQALVAKDITCKTSGCSDISENSVGMEDADVVIVTAGFPRKPGMSRDDLLAKNAEVISNVGKAIKAKAPNAFVICITNPLDVMVSLLQKSSGFPPSKVVGMAGMLDSSRFRSFLAEELGVSARDVHTCVLGGHGDDMVPLISATAVNGIPLTSIVKMGMITMARVQEIIERTRVGGGEIVNLLKMGSAFVAPAVCAVEMAKSYLRDERRVMPCCAQMNGEYGISCMYGGVPCIIGSEGVQKILELPLTPEEKANFDKSMKAVSDLRETCRNLGFDA